MTRSKALPAPNVLLLGGSGTGKTYSLRTLVDCGITPCVIFTEPGMEVLGDLPRGSYHAHYIPPSASNWAGLLDIASKVNKFDFNALTKMSDANRSKYTQFLEVIETCNNFKCDITGEELGDCMTWGTDRALVVDSLSGLNKMAMQLVVGGKPTKAMSDWMIAQDMIRKLMDTLTTSVTAWMIVIAHISRETDEITGGTHLTVNTLGRALAPEIPLFFSDVIQTQRVGSQFFWDTAGSNIDVKARNLPIASKLPPDFKQIVDSWKKAGGVIGSSTPTQEAK